MKDRILKEYGHITSRKIMKDVVVNMWNDFEDDRWDHLIESMPDRIRVVIKAKGSLTSY